MSITGPNRLSRPWNWGIDADGPATFAGRLSPPPVRGGTGPSAGFALFPMICCHRTDLPFRSHPSRRKSGNDLREQFAPLNRSGWRQGLKSLRRRWRVGASVGSWHQDSSALVARRGGETELAGSLLDRLTSQAIGSTAQPLLLLVRLTHALVVPVYREGCGGSGLSQSRAEPLRTRVTGAARTISGHFSSGGCLAGAGSQSNRFGRVQGLPYFCRIGVAWNRRWSRSAAVELLEQNALATLQAWNMPPGRRLV